MLIRPYLFFDGRCEEALEFYRGELGAEVTTLILTPHSEAAMGSTGHWPDGMTMRARIQRTVKPWIRAPIPLGGRLRYPTTNHAPGTSRSEPSHVG